MEKIILTGASDGIGKAIALEFARRGHELALIARREEKLREVQKECEKLGASRVLVAPVDVADETRFEQALGELDDALSGATIFIANAGVSDRSHFTERAWPEVKRCFQVNILAAIHGLEFMKIRMLRRGRGTLCGVSSVAASRGMPTAGGYSTSKAALATHLETLRVDLQGRGLSVVDVAPGFIDTAMTKKNMGNMPFLMQPEPAARIFVDGILRRKRFVVAPRQWRVIYPLLKMLPRSWFDWGAARMYRSIRGPE